MASRQVKSHVFFGPFENAVPPPGRRLIFSHIDQRPGRPHRHPPAGRRLIFHFLTNGLAAFAPSRAPPQRVCSAVSLSNSMGRRGAVPGAVLGRHTRRSDISTPAVNSLNENPSLVAFGKAHPHEPESEGAISGVTQSRAVGVGRSDGEAVSSIS